MAQGSSKAAAVAVGPLKDSTGFWLQRVASHASLALNRALEGAGTTGGEWALLRVLHDGPAAPSLLADRVGLTRGAVTKLADRLIARDLIRREGDDSDGRRQTLTLTAAGRRLVPKLAAIAEANDTALFGDLGTGQSKGLMTALRSLARAHGLGAE